MSVSARPKRTHIAGQFRQTGNFTLCGLRMSRRNETVPAGEATCRYCRTLNDPRPVSFEFKRLTARAEARIAGRVLT